MRSAIYEHHDTLICMRVFEFKCLIIDCRGGDTQSTALGIPASSYAMSDLEYIKSHLKTYPDFPRKVRSAL